MNLKSSELCQEIETVLTSTEPHQKRLNMRTFHKLREFEDKQQAIKLAAFVRSILQYNVRVMGTTIWVARGAQKAGLGQIKQMEPAHV